MGSVRVPPAVNSVLIDARLGIRGLGIGTFIDRLQVGLTSEPSVSPVLWKGSGTWGAGGVLSTFAHSGAFDLSPRLDPRSWRFDVIHLASNLGAVFPGHRSVITVYDLLHRRHGRRRDRLTGFLLERSISRAARVVAISQRTRDEIEAAFPTLAGRVELIPAGMRRLAPPTGPRQHVLAFGGASDPRKRTDLMVQTYAAYRATTRDPLPLVVLARAGLTPAQHERLTELGARILPSASGDEVDRLMGHAAALLYPTLAEGFGFPILEAAELETPVLLDSSAAVATELLGSHCFFVDGDDPQAWAARLRDAVDNGPVHGALDLPDWGAVAHRYAEIYREVALA